MTRREKVLQLLKSGEMSCNDFCIIIVNEIRANRPLTQRSRSRDITNMNASLSGTLNQMVKRGEIELSSNKGPKGGKIYKLKII